MGNLFYENLKSARQSKGLSQKEVAQAIGVAKSTYSLYESGSREPNVQTIKKIANTLNVSANILLGLDEPQTISTRLNETEFTSDELSRIEEFANFVKSNRKK